MQAVPILALQLKKVKTIPTSVKRERTFVKNGRYIPSWIWSVFCRFTCGLVRVGCAKTTLDMFWTARALTSTVGQTGPCTFNTNVQNATDTYLNGSLEYLGWGLVWQESGKKCLGLVNFFASKVKYGSILHLTRGNRLVFLVVCLLFDLLVQTELIARQQIYNTSRKWKCCAIASKSTLHRAIFLANKRHLLAPPFPPVERCNSQWQLSYLLRQDPSLSHKSDFWMVDMLDIIYMNASKYAMYACRHVPTYARMHVCVYMCMCACV